MAVSLVHSPALLLPVALPLATAALTLALRRNEPLRDSIPVIGSLLTLLSVLTLLPTVQDGTILCFTVCTLYPGIAVRLCLDGMGLLFAATASLLWVAASVYCIGYLKTLQEHAQTRFYVCYTIALAGGLGAACAGNLFTLYLCYEVVTIVTYPLVIHHQDTAAYQSGRKYLVYLMGSSKMFLLAALALMYRLCGTLDMNLHDIVHGIFPATAQRGLVSVAYLLCLFGFAKAAIMPLHSWLPAAMVAPTPVSALLHAVVVVKVGVFSICRVMLNVFGTDLLMYLNLGTLTAGFVSLTVIGASLIALIKTDLKARLAYSTISQLSTIVLGVSMLGHAGITGGLMHIAHHAFAKISLFFCAGAVIAGTGITDITHMAGIGRRMPITMAAFGIASLSMIGIPPVGGFVSKWYLASAALDLHSILLLGVILVSSLLNAAYFGEVFITAFFKGGTESSEHKGTCEHAPLMRCMVVPSAVTALLSVAAGMYPDLILSLLRTRL
ncbi:MAG: monovalent cation/H+ antiporter subunit D family protein [Desulfobacterota bacterium]|nr:monovalent cation/H+ antiporter subunit D family protein [Thermodesulfobacteriota bacterium]